LLVLTLKKLAKAATLQEVAGSGFDMPSADVTEAVLNILSTCRPMLPWQGALR